MYRSPLALIGLILVLLLLGTPAQAELTMEQIKKEMTEGEKFRAYLHLRTLADRGNPEAQFHLAGFYHYGYVGPVSFEAARYWYGRSARQGNSEAMIGLAVLDQLGQGAPVDKREALVWVTIAGHFAIRNPDRALLNETRDRLIKELSPNDVETAIAQARSFAPRSETPAP
ncbi:MAG TPA: hypothetical protein VHL08_01510 [Dongiaceae bacterium]|nr:hypothetical protein [Dongiaceae bacterium]